jgi:hypothetical protein
MFFLTEVGATSRGLSWELGGMYNLNKRSALGATFFLSTRVYDDLAAGSIDISPGLVLWTQWPDPTFKKGPTFTGHVGFNYKDMITLMVQVYVRRYRFQKNKLSFSLGLKFGSYAGIVLGVATVIVATVFGQRL